MYPDLPNHEFARLRYAEALRNATKRHELHSHDAPAEPQRYESPGLLARVVARLPVGTKPLAPAARVG